MNSWIRQHIYAINVAFRRLCQTPFSSLSNIIVIAFVLALPIIASAVIISLAPLTKQVSVNPTISSFMSKSTSLGETEQLAQMLNDKYKDLVDNVEVIDKSTALENLRQTPSWSETIDSLTQNPLPHAIIITLKLDTESFNDVRKAQKLVDALQAYDEIDLVQFDSQWVQKLNTILKFGVTVLILLAVGVTIVVIGTVFNTVRMQALVQRDEIAVARLLGATETFVRRPFLYFGAMTGFFASVLSVIFSLIMLLSADHVISSVAGDASSTINFQLPGFFWLFMAIVLTILVAALAARWSVTRNSRF